MMILACTLGRIGSYPAATTARMIFLMQPVSGFWVFLVLFWYSLRSFFSGGDTLGRLVMVAVMLVVAYIFMTNVYGVDGSDSIFSLVVDGGEEVTLNDFMVDVWQEG